MSLFSEALQLAMAELITSDLSDSVTWMQPASDPFPVRAIVDKGSAFEQRTPGMLASVLVRVADFTERPRIGDQVVIENVIHRVAEITSDDGSGTVTCFLRLHR